MPDSGVIDAGEPDAGMDAGSVENLPPIPANTEPCVHPEYWPESLQSTRFPFTVHYRAPSEKAQAERVLAILDNSWHVEVEQLGFRAPLDDHGQCGADGRFDVFLWRGIDECYVDVLGDETSTSYDDQLAFMVVDAWGIYAGDILDATLAHELNHACQAADDWHDNPAIYEMTSVLMEEAVYDDDNGYRAAVVPDFQSRPDWGIDRDDNYDTWFMYGGGLYLMYLRDRFFAGSYSWAAQMWLGMRSPAGNNEPDYVDALEPLLAAKGSTFVDSVLGFARWRWYVGSRDDGAHLREAAFLAQPKSQTTLAVNQMMLGSTYIDVTGSAAMTVTVTPSTPSSTRRWVIQAVPGVSSGEDGETLTSGGQLSFVGGKRTLIITLLPGGAYDPDDRTDNRYAATVTLTP